jgi:hypothetical protein
VLAAEARSSKSALAQGRRGDVDHHLVMAAQAVDLHLEALVV